MNTGGNKGFVISSGPHDAPRGYRTVSPGSMHDAHQGDRSGNPFDLPFSTILYQDELYIIHDCLCYSQTQCFN